MHGQKQKMEQAFAPAANLQGPTQSIDFIAHTHSWPCSQFKGLIPRAENLYNTVSENESNS